MKTEDRRSRSYALLLALLVLAEPALGRAATPRPLNRSLYIPVSFTLCPHLTRAILFMGQQPMGVLPVDRVFQFTYYPNLKRIEPEVNELRIEGAYLEGSNPFLARLAITPQGIYTASRQVSLDMPRQVEKLRYKIDVHYEKVYLRFLCATVCSREADREPARSEMAMPSPVSHP